MTAAQAVSPLLPASPIADAAALAPIDRGRALFDLLREKWKEVPAGIYDRADTTKLLQLADWELRDYWESVWSETSTGPGYATRGWYQDLYRDQFRGKRVLEIGSGCGVDGIHFIRNGAKWYFADIVPSNLKLIRRILDSFGLDCEGMTYIEDLGSLDQIPDGFDFIYCNGSMIHVPFAFSRRETLALASHLKPGGRWVELCYTRERWAREGRLPFSDWGKATDGEATQWAEWYDVERLRDRFAPLAFQPLLAFPYYDDDYVWFDLRLDAPPDRASAATLVDALPPRLPIALAPGGFNRHGATTLDAVNTPDGPALRVQTDPAFWSFALQGTLPGATLQQALGDIPDGSLPAIELLVSVQKGRVGVGLMSEDLRNFVGLEQHLPQRGEPYTVKIPCPPGQERYDIILRNTQGGDIASGFILHQMALTTMRVDTADAAGDDAAVISLTALLRRHQGHDVPALAPDVPVYVRAVPVEALDRAFGYEEASDDIPDEDALLDYFERNHRGNTVLIAGAAGWNEVARESVDILLIDGAQGADALRHDTDKAIALLRHGGLMLWRGFCPQSDALQAFPEARNLALAIHQGWRSWAPAFATMFWVSGSHLLVGVKR